MVFNCRKQKCTIRAKSSNLPPLGCNICLKPGTIKCSWFICFFAITQTKAVPKEEIPQEQAWYIASFCSMLLQMHQTLQNYFSSWDRHWFLHTRPWFYCPHTLHQPSEELARGWDLHRFSPGITPILVCSDHNENCTRVLATWDPTPVRQMLPCRMPWVSHPWVKIPGKLKKSYAPEKSHWLA